MTAAEQLADELDRVLVRPVREAADDETADALAALFDPAAMLGDPGRVLAIIGQHARPAEWWGTPLGRLCAPHSDATVTHAEAAALLGVARGRISSLLADGHLDRRGGRVTVASVAARLDRLSPDGGPRGHVEQDHRLALDVPDDQLHGHAPPELHVVVIGLSEDEVGVLSELLERTHLIAEETR